MSGLANTADRAPNEDAAALAANGARARDARFSPFQPVETMLTISPVAARPFGQWGHATTRSDGLSAIAPRIPCRSRFP